ncbi:hypothetical protein SAY86_031607 [Trapa natans]|uniref:Uncharacterized protein n=1 Tax=Trapa natans TaxID=22666 RepID=A0AAN7R3P0_TRANT|nr:hypothetical protein SAY86_031607 [Trapa natans]
MDHSNTIHPLTFESHPSFQSTQKKKKKKKKKEVMSSCDDSISSVYKELYGKASEDIINKLRPDVANGELRQRGEASEHNLEEEEEERDGEEEEPEFSFACLNLQDNSPISADDVFQNGQIRPVYPLFDRSLLFGSFQDEIPKATESSSHPRQPLKKLFISTAEPEELDGVDEGTYCILKGKTVVEAASPEGCRKSNSTGFSRLWRFRDLVHRSSSDGEDAFVFLNTHRAHGGGGNIHHAKKEEDARSEKVGRTAGNKMTTAMVTAKGRQTAHEKHYVRNRASRESNRRKSYLPYRQNLVGLGFFTNVNGMTQNVHPF